MTHEIYLVTRHQQLFESENYTIISVDESLRMLSKLNTVGVDTETKGLDPHTGTLLTLQLGCFDFQIVIDCTTIDILLYKDFLESDRLFLFWNARFDLKWLFKYRIVPKWVYDGFLAEKLMWLGYPIVLTEEKWNIIKCPRYDHIIPKPDSRTNKSKKPYYMIQMNLKKAGEMYLGIELDKTVRGQIMWKGLVEEVIIYAALDVKYLERIKDLQYIELNKRGLLKAMEYENRFIIPLAYMEFCGVKLDVARWKAKIDRDQRDLDAVIEKMNDWLVEHDPTNPNIYINLQGDLFAENPFDTKPRVKINWNSSTQMIPIFKKFGVDVEVEDKDSLDDETKDSLNEKVLAPQKDKCSLIPLYLEFKGLMKLVSTYGQNVLDQINPNTNRLHTNFNPLGTDTARISSGGKDKANNIKYINFLNIPSDAETRACFIAEPGNKWISIDYSG